MLDQKYVEAVLRGMQDKENSIDYVYDVYLHKDGLIFGNKRFDVNDADNIITDIVRYVGTSALYELIFPDDAFYTEDDTSTRACCCERAQTQIHIRRVDY